MAYVNVPKDLTKIKSKVLFNLTKRQLLCFGRNRKSRQRLDRHGTIVVGSCETFHHYNVQGVK